MFDSLLEQLIRREIDINVLDNIGSDDFRSKFNNLINFFIGQIGSKKDSTFTREEKRRSKRVLDYNKDAIIFYLNMTLYILSNQQIDENKLQNADFSFITDFKNSLNMNDLEGKKLIIQQIRNSFAHKTGELNIYIDDNKKKKIEIDNKSWFSIEADLKKLNELLSDIIIKDNNYNKKVILDAIECVKKGNYEGISDDALMLISMSLLMCYNKESLFDRFVMSQSSLLDASKFNINSTSNWKQYDSKVIDSFFSKYNLDFYSDNDKQVYDAEWRSIYNINDYPLRKDSNYTFNVSKMPFDSYTGKHIPTPIFLTLLRHSVSHGYIRMDKDFITFYVKENRSNDEYFYMQINKKDLMDFISSDYFVEGLLTPVRAHKSHFKSNLYSIEQAESANDFANYINTFKTRLPNLSEEEVIKYMYDNNKISSFLMEYPEQVNKFLSFKMENGDSITQFLSDYSGAVCNMFDYYYNSKYSGTMNVFVNTVLAKGKASYELYLKDNNHNFFANYSLFQKNLKSVEKKHNSIFDLDESELYKLISSSRAFEKIVNKDNNPMGSVFWNRILLEASMQENNIDELTRLLISCYLHNNILFKEENENIKEKRYTIKNIRKSGTLGHLVKSAKWSLMSGVMSDKNLVDTSLIYLTSGLSSAYIGLLRGDIFTHPNLYLGALLASTGLVIADNVYLRTKEKKQILEWKKLLDKVYDLEDVNYDIRELNNILGDEENDRDNGYSNNR